MSEWIPYTFSCDDEGYETITTRDQKNVEKSVLDINKKERKILRIKHRDYLISMISGLPHQFESVCYQEPWLPYWFINSMHVLKLQNIGGFQVFNETIIQYLKKRISKDGGYASSPEQKGNTVLTYTAINSLATIGTEAAFKTIDRNKIYKFLLSVKQENGSFESETGSEADTRSTYCAICVASLLNILTPELEKNVVDFISKSQGYDGGFGPMPHCETHGGYGFCSIGALSILNSINSININKAINWCAKRQMPFSGGFNGRTNKLVDTCYTWWVGAMARTLADEANIPPFWNDYGISNWVLTVCQSPNGGCFDKPGVKVDLFHTMYGLTGLSVTAQKIIADETGFTLNDVDSRYAIPKVAVERIQNYFKQIPFNPE